MTKQKLLELLETWGIDPGHFGQGEAKTLDDLLKEIESGEATLAENKGRLVRQVNVVVVYVFAQIGRQRLMLVEDRQVFADGRERKPKRSGLCEKILPQEDAHAALCRALKEEIGITKFETSSPEPSLREQSSESPSYPGLFTEYKRYVYDVLIDDSEYKPEGYQEVQPEKTIYFVWQPA